MIKLTTPNEPGFYMPYIREPDGSLELVPDVQFILDRYPDHVVKNLKGDIVKGDFSKEHFRPKSFADYFLYVYEHAFVADITKSVAVMTFMADTPQPCGVCGTPTSEFYPEPFQKNSKTEDAIIYAVCEDCWDDTHLAHVVLRDENES